MLTWSRIQHGVANQSVAYIYLEQHTARSSQSERRLACAEVSVANSREALSTSRHRTPLMMDLLLGLVGGEVTVGLPPPNITIS